MKLLRIISKKKQMAIEYPTKTYSPQTYMKDFMKQEFFEIAMLKKNIFFHYKQILMLSCITIDLILAVRLIPRY